MSQPQRTPSREPAAQPQDGRDNIWRDVMQAIEAYGSQPPTLFPALTKARQAQIADNVDELDARLLDVIVATHASLLKIRTAFPHLTTRHSE